MAKKNTSGGGIIYSTNKELKIGEEPQESVVLSPAEQMLTVKLDTKQRGGKAVTLINGYRGNDIEETGKKLKVYCGTGGSVKDGQIIVQGDNREKVTQWLLKNGFRNVKKG